MLDKEFRFYLNHQEDLLKAYNGKYIVIIGEEVVGQYDAENIAYFESRKKYPPGSFLIQFCSPGEEAYTQIFHSQVGFT
jgi:hypothetical protein